MLVGRGASGVEYAMSHQGGGSAEGLIDAIMRGIDIQICGEWPRQRDSAEWKITELSLSARKVNA